MSPAITIPLAAETVSLARSRRIPVDEGIARSQRAAIGRYVESWRERTLQGVGIPGNSDTISYILLGLAAERHPPDAATDAMVRFLRLEQREDGHWRLLAHRPPIESSELQVTAMSMRALQPHFESGFPHGRDQFISAAATNWAARALAYTVSPGS